MAVETPDHDLASVEEEPIGLNHRFPEADAGEVAVFDAAAA